MRKLLFIGCLLLITACQAPTSTPTTGVLPTETLPPTLEATPIPSPTLTAVPVPLYFTDEFDLVSPYWEVFQTGGTNAPVASVESGALNITLTSQDTWAVGVFDANTYSNVFIRANVSSNAAGSVGLVCHYDEKSGWFEFNISSKGTYSLLYGQWLAPGIARYDVIASGAASKANLGGQANQLGFFCDDAYLHLFVNDTPIRNVDVTNYGLTGGNIGITVSSFEAVPMTGRFEWVKVSQE